MIRLRLARGSRITRELWQVVPSTGTSKSINSKIHACSCSGYLTRKRPACTDQINHNNSLFFFHHHRLPVRVGAHHGVLCPAGWLRGKEAGLLSRPATILDSCIFKIEMRGISYIVIHTDDVDGVSEDPRDAKDICDPRRHTLGLLSHTIY